MTVRLIILTSALLLVFVAALNAQGEISNAHSPQAMIDTGESTPSILFGENSENQLAKPQTSKTAFDADGAAQPGSLAPPQDTSRLWIVETVDGNRYVGRILEDDQERIIIETKVVGTVTIPKQSIRSLELVDSRTKLGDGSAWSRNPQADSYFFFNSAYNLEAGEGYYQNVLILFNQVDVGLTDNISLGVGTLPAFLFGGPTPFWLAPKVSIPVASDQFQLGGGALIGTVIGSGESGFGGLAYGLGTFGSRDRNLTLGVGYGFTDQEWLDIPAIMLGGMLRIGQKGYLIADSFLLSADGSTGGIVAFGGRTVWPNIALSYGGLTAFADDEILPAVLPWLGVSVFFGKK